MICFPYYCFPVQIHKNIVSLSNPDSLYIILYSDKQELYCCIFIFKRNKDAANHVPTLLIVNC